MANRRHPMQLHRTTVTIAGIAAVITAITTVRVSTDRQNQKDKIKKGEPGGSPFFPNWLCRLRSAPSARMLRERLAPRERCVQLWFSSKPGGVMSPPELMELSTLGLLPLRRNCK